MSKSGLGKGLGALIPGKDPKLEAQNNNSAGFDESIGGILTISTKLIDPNPYQPRKDFNEESLNVLADSIKQFGILQPLIVRKAEDRFQLIAGERRLRAAKLAGIERVPVVLKESGNELAFEEAIIENVQREDINSLEEAAAYRRLIEEFSLSHEQISKRVGKSRTNITNTLRLMNLPASIQRYIREGKITPGHARAILSLVNRFDQEKLAEKIMKEGLSVRETEKLIAPKEKTKKKVKALSQYIDAEEQLEDFLDTDIQISSKKIQIRFSDNDDLTRIFKIITSSK
jgi:ParB family chromosome partitioning protein